MKKKSNISYLFQIWRQYWTSNSRYFLLPPMYMYISDQSSLLRKPSSVGIVSPVHAHSYVVKDYTFQFTLLFVAVRLLDMCQKTKLENIYLL